MESVSDEDAEKRRREDESMKRKERRRRQNLSAIEKDIDDLITVIGTAPNGESERRAIRWTIRSCRILIINQMRSSV
jgi:hypothetical protein